MVQIKVKVDFKPFERLLLGMQRQLPFATARALTKTAKDVQDAEQREMALVFKDPTTFTVKQGVGITYATKATLQSVVFLKRKQAIYLQAQIEGGTRRRKPFEAQFAREQSADIASSVPGRGAKKTAQGNLSKATIAKLGRDAKVKKRRGVFYAKLANGVSAIFQRVGRDIEPILVFSGEPAKYRKRFDFYGIAQRTVSKVWQRNFNASLEAAIASAR
jgi:hypothetical protein